MFYLIFLWLVFCAFSFGISGFIFVSMRRAAKRPWCLKLDRNYRPKVSILVPTYNEEDVIQFKLKNLVKVKYPKDLMQIIVVDSNSKDQTVKLVRDFATRHPENNIQVLVESERRGKSASLNFALKNCEGEIVVVSDADCFWPSEILERTMPFLADPTVGAVSGPKILLNPEQSWVTKTENAYLNSMNMVRFGESKIGSTLLFEGGFSAYKRGLLDSFDPYNTGSDDCGSIVKLAEKGYRAICVPEACFYSTFPKSWKEKLSIKVRRANQLVRVLWKYFCLLLKGHIKVSKRVVVQGILIYLVSPIMFIAFATTTIILLFNFPYFSLMFLTFLLPNVGFYLFESIQSYLILFVSMLAVLMRKKFVVWKKPKDRSLLHENVLRQYGLI
jgi:cellulose synthase/poly-beta-1,6-N-acetylglucosamine synthase-like glycosyltransferase